MKKLIMFIPFIFIYNIILFAETIELKLKNNSYLCNTDSIYKNIPLDQQGVVIEKNTKVTYIIGDDYFIAPYSTYTVYPYYYVTIDSGKQGYVIMDDCNVLLNKEIFKKYPNAIDDKCWISKYTFDILKSNSVNTLFLFEPFWKTSWKTSTGEKWNEDNSLTFFIMNDKYVFFYCYEDSEGSYLVTSAQDDGKYIKLELFTREKVYLSGDKNIFLSRMAQPGKYTLYLKFDGDYLTLYLNDYNTSPLVELAFTNDYMSILHKYRAIAKNEKITLDDIVWPRHADGTCDYDGSSKPAAKIKPAVEGIQLSAGMKRTASTNLRLRSTKSTASTVITTMGKGTGVKVIAVGDRDSIDGIASNWVQVEVLSGAKNKDGNEIPAGTTGWCFGGYLE